MKNIIFSFIGVLIILISSSCEEWLDLEPRSSKPVGGTTAVDAQASVDGIYAFLRPVYGGIRSMSMNATEVLSDQYRSITTDDGSMDQIARLDFDHNNLHFANLWNSCYGGIEAANIAISTIPTITDPNLNDNLRNQLLGEAHFLRAFYYFRLVQLFGEIPIKTEPTTSDQDGQIGKSPEVEVYENVIVPDLIIAGESGRLPATSSSGRVSNGSAKALLAKVYLTMAGYPLQQTDKYALAKQAAQEVMDGRYNLFQTEANLTWFDKLNNEAFDNLEENIFMIQYSTGIIGQEYSKFLTPNSQAGKLTKSGPYLGGIVPTEKFYNSYTAEDLRAQNQGFFFDHYDTPEYGMLNFPLSVYKYFDEELRTESSFRIGKNIVQIRYADVLLVYAEAQNEADGSPDELAYKALNDIRSRSGLDALQGLTKDQFREAVWRERAWELTCEGQVWFDMKRTRKAFNGTSFSDLIGYTLTNGSTFTEESLYFLIPQFDIDSNPLLN